MEVNIAGWSQDDRNWPESDVYFRGDGGVVEILIFINLHFQVQVDNIMTGLTVQYHSEP